MQTKTSFVRSDCTVELYTISFVYMCLALIIYPRYTEHNNSFRLNDTLQQSFFSVLFFICIDYRTQRIQYFFYSLVEFWFVRIFSHNVFIYFIYIRHVTRSSLEFAHCFLNTQTL